MEMGGGGLMQIVATGAQDVFLTGSPDKTFFRQRHARHSNFAQESMEQSFSGTVAYGGKASCTIVRNGDLLSNLVLEITMKRTSEDTFYPAEHLLREVSLEIGGQRIELMTNTWLRLYDELYRKVDSRSAYEEMANFTKEPVGSVKRFYVSLPFWFCRDMANALPLIALQYHEVRLHFEFEAASNIPGIDATVQPEVRLWADYVYLDNEERRWFAQAEHQYLIEQTQLIREPVNIGPKIAQFNVDLSFNHPVKYLAWVFKKGTESHGVFTARNDQSMASDNTTPLVAQGLESMEVCAPLESCGMQLNGIDRFNPRKGSYFRLVQPSSAFGHAPSAGVYVYSFALHPADLSPSGTLNCSRIDAFTLQLRTKAATLSSTANASTDSQALQGIQDLKIVEIYARNYNVLRIMSGMGGISFSN